MNKIIFKSIFITTTLLMLMLCAFIGMRVEASSETGHDSFDEITVPNGSNAKLLINMLQSDKEKALKKVKWCFFGWKTNNICKNEVVNYLARTVFARSNRTQNPITFNYKVSTGKTVTNSTSISGSLGLKASGKIKSLSLGGDFTMKTDKQTTVRRVDEEVTDFSIKIQPFVKVSLFVKGKAKLTNGASKYYAIGIPIKKGYYEFIDVLTEYYELYEESL